MPLIEIAARILRGSDLGIPGQIFDRPTRIENEVRNVRARKAEVRRVREVESLEAELGLEAIFDREIAGHRKIHVDDAGAAHGAKAGVAESQSGDRLESQRI